MSKARKYGTQRVYIPNARADMRFRKKVYQHGRAIVERDVQGIRQEKEQKRRERGKC